MLKSKILAVLFVVLVLAGAAPSWAQTVAAPEDEGKLIAVLKSDSSSHKAKVDACRQLSIIATKDAIAPLAALLSDEKLSHMARYALEPIPDPEVDEVFRAALGTLKGKPLVGVIGSIGVRRDARAVEPLEDLLMQHEAGPEAMGAAVRTLGKIGTPAAAELLMTGLDHAPPEGRADLYEGLFRCAEALAAADGDKAIEIYDTLRKLDAPHQVRAGALRGAILTRGVDGLSLLEQYLKSDDYILFSAAVQTAQEMPGTGVTKVLATTLGGLPADSQILVAQTLGLRGDVQALPALFATAQRGATPARIAAIQAVAEISDASAVEELVVLLEAEDRAVAQAAQEALGSLPGLPADAAAMTMFRSSSTEKRLAALQLMERRRMTQAVPALLEAAEDGDPEVRQAAIKMVGELGGPEQLSALLDVLMELKTTQDLEAARQAISDVCGQADEPESCSGQLIGRLDRAHPDQKIVVLRVLSGVGGGPALQAVHGAVGDANAEVHAAAIRALGSWKTTDAAPLLLDLAKTAKTDGDKARCLRAYLGMAARRDLPVGERLSMCRQAAGMVQSDGEKRLLLGTLGGIDSPEALAIIAPYLSDAAIRREAALASLAIAERLLKGRQSGRFAPELIAPLEKVIQVLGDDDLANRAKGLRRQARTKAGR
jgi:HEAT repeat protein